MSRRRPQGRPPDGARGGPSDGTRGSGRAGASRPFLRAPEPPRPSPALPLTHPAHVAALLVAAACVLYSVTYRIADTDVWQHLAVGRAIWTLHAVPKDQIWNWPGYGAPYVTPSWAFRALLWPFWVAGGVPGLFVWRWLTTLAAFALLWATARRMGARGLTPLVALVVASLAYRARAQVRPESLAAVLFALELWILETRRAGGRDHTFWLVPIAWAWANLHVSYPLAFVVLALHDAGTALGAWITRGRAGRSASAAPLLGRDGLVALAMAAISFVNPYGGRALAQPFEYFLFWRHEAIFKTVSELEAVSWRTNLVNGLPLLVFGWPLLILWRARRGALDVAEALLAAYLIATALPTQRFVGTLALGAAPYFARDLDAWVRARRWPSWTAGAVARGLLVAAACVGVSVAEWSHPTFRPGVGLDADWFPVRACDFIAAHGVRGRAFNDYYLGGYMLWRFWPERDRLPFIDIHQTGTREDRALAAAVTTNPDSWQVIDRRHRFDYVLLNRYWIEGDRSLDALDADANFALVFMDDAAALYVRCSGPLSGVADSFAYHVVPAGPAKVRGLVTAISTDSTRRAAAKAELMRMARASEFNGSAHSDLANLAMMEGRLADARRELTLALAADPRTPYARERLAIVAVSEARPRAALDALAREKATDHRDIREHLRREARALERQLESRRSELRAAAAREPGRRDLADSLAAVERRLAR